VKVWTSEVVLHTAVAWKDAAIKVKNAAGANKMLLQHVMLSPEPILQPGMLSVEPLTCYYNR